MEGEDGKGGRVKKEEGERQGGKGEEERGRDKERKKGGEGSGE